MKKIMIAAAVVLVAVVGGVVFIYSNLGGLIKEAIQTYGSEATKAKVSLTGVDIDATSGKAALNGLVVGNPGGFKTPSAFELGGIAVQIDTSTLNKQTIVIKSVEIKGPKVTYELGGSGSNVDAIKNNVDQYAKKLGGGSSGGSSSSGGSEKKIVIDKLTITGGVINVSAAFLGGKALGTKLPTITLTDIGKDKGGASPAEVIKLVIDKMTAGVGSAVSGLNLGDMAKQAEGAAKKALEGAAAAGAGAMKSVTEGAGSTGGAASGAVEGAGKKLKGLLGN